MANGRMINHAITKDLRINQLSDDTSRLAFTWLIPFADREGRTYGDPAIVRSMLFPRREDISISRMAEYIQEWHELGLIIWYEAEGDKFIFFPAFGKNQPGMRPERESPSIIPAPPTDEIVPDELRSNDGVTPDDSRIKLKEVKLKEQNPAAAAAFSKFQNEIGMLTPKTSEMVGGWVDDYSDSWTCDAIDEAVKNNARKPAYIDAILKRWKSDGRNDYFLGNC